MTARILGAYGVFSFVWILLGDNLLFRAFNEDNELMLRAGNLKGIMFALLSMILIGVLLTLETRRKRLFDADFQLLFENNPQPMWVYEPETARILEVNNAAIKQYGYTRNQFLKMTLHAIHPPDDLTGLEHHIHQTDANLIYQDRHEHVTRSGERMVVDVISQRLQYQSGAVRLVIAQDVTERTRLDDERALNEALRVKLTAEREANEARSQFASMVSHEFRTPIAAITTAASLLKRYISRLRPEKVQESLDTILDRSQQLDAMLDDMLTVLRAESQRSAFKPVFTDLTSLCQQTIQEVQQSVDETRTITLETSEKAIHAEVDLELVQRVMRNLLSNAVKYSAADEAVEVHLREAEGEIQFTVRDHGIGIPQADLDDLFTPFKRANNVGAIPGTGLGLVIVKQAVEYHGGRVIVESVENSGTTFSVSLPKRQGDRLLID